MRSRSLPSEQERARAFHVMTRNGAGLPDGASDELPPDQLMSNRTLMRSRPGRGDYGLGTAMDAMRPVVDGIAWHSLASWLSPVKAAARVRQVFVTTFTRSVVQGDVRVIPSRLQVETRSPWLVFEFAVNFEDALFGTTFTRPAVQ